jgi:molecular chaperone DnaJ
MASKRDYYEVLGVQRNASGDEIRDAFRRQAKEYHPDLNKTPGAEERFKEINEAYAVLSDASKRAKYDQFGHAGLEGVPLDFDFGFGIGDIFGELFGFGTRRGSPRSPRRGADLRYDVTLDFKEAVFGVDRTIEFSRHEVCSSCDGSGAEPGTTPQRCNTCQGSGEVRQVRQTFLGSMVNVSACPNCGGRGEIITTPCQNCKGRGIEKKHIQRVIPIPAGVDEGTRIRLAGEGEPGMNRGPKGDLYVIVHVKPHRFFRRHRNDIVLDLQINVAQATLGARVSVPTVEGETSIDIPPGTQTGKVLRLRGMGVPRLKRNGRGDQKVVISVEIPRRLSQEQRALFEKLADSMGTEARPQERGFLDKIKELLGGLAD